VLVVMNLIPWWMVVLTFREEGAKRKIEGV
jgi:hypothetical protein